MESFKYAAKVGGEFLPINWSPENKDLREEENVTQIERKLRGVLAEKHER